MEDLGFVHEDVIGQIDFDNLFDDLPEGGVLDDLLEFESPNDADWNRSPDSVSSWIGELESYLMRDDDDKVGLESSEEFAEKYLVDLLVDSPGSGSGEIVDCSNDKDSSGSDDNEPRKVEKEKGEDEKVNDKVEATDDPISKKQRRQLRNRDAAVKSRERKKMYVKELEMKSRYLEGECRRLGRLLQSFVAENQALKFSLQNGSTFGGTMTKQESAVLLLESLLLGSLLWFLAAICPLQSTVEAVSLENVGKKGLESLNPRGPKSKMFGPLPKPCFINTRRCKSSRTKMKPSTLVF